MSEPYGAKTAEARAQAAAIRQGLATRASAVVHSGVQPAQYAGLVTRTVAFAADGAVINGVAVVVGVTLALAMSVLHLSSHARTIVEAIAGGAWVIWPVCYFAFFWSGTGQTPGNRLMRIRVADRDERGPLKPLRAVARFGFLILAVLPLGAGIVMMLWDSRARCLQDRLARTVVVYAPAESDWPPPEAAPR